VVTALAALVAPGVGRPAAEWRRGLAALRAAPAAVTADGRPATMADFDLLVGRLATFTRLSGAQRSAFIKNAQVREVPEGSRLVTKGDKATAAFFILEGEAAAGIPEEDGSYRGLSTMAAGDFFGEIAALTGSPRTADVVATRPSTLLEVPADALRGVMEVPEVNKLLLSTLTERLLRSDQPDLPRLASMNQAALRDLRTKAPLAEAQSAAYDAGI
jgi:CRP-like cAMP-binding protein